MAAPGWFDIGIAGMIFVASALYPSSNDEVAVHRELEIAAHGCRDHRGRFHPEGTRVDQSVVTGIITMTVVPIWYICRNGRWIKNSGQTLRELKPVASMHSGATGVGGMCGLGATLIAS